MTSSLVGSEMCIRDRARGVPACAAAVAAAPTAHPAAAAATADADAVATVSYTHLTLPTICSV
eukprot:7149509-Prorocentrum_lima.AAC.1